MSEAHDTFEVIELEPDDLAEYESLAMCDCAGRLDKLYAVNPDPTVISIASMDIFEEVSSISRTLLALAQGDHAAYADGIVAPALQQMSAKPRRVLIIGGGDGVVARRLLDDGAESIVLVDVRKPVTDAYSAGALGRDLNGNVLSDKRLTIVNALGDEWLRSPDGKEACKSGFDLIVLDLACTKLLQETAFYREIVAVLTPGGALVAQDVFPLEKNYSEEIKKAFEFAGLSATASPHPLRSLPAYASAFVVVGVHKAATAP